MSLIVKNLSFSYGKNEVLRDVSFSADTGNLVCILGPNGVGKSTLFRCILGLEKPTEGSILAEGQDISKSTIRERAKLMAYIPQSHAPTFQYSVYDMVIMGTVSQVGAISMPAEAQRQVTEEVMKHLNIWHLRERGYLHTSGGEQQLVCIARALVQGAKILVMDEPTANLDYGNQVMVQTQLKKLTKEGYTILQSTHNPEQAFLYGDQILTLLDGRVDSFGKPEEILDKELIKRLYHVDVEIHSLCNDKLRVCVPNNVLEERREGIR